ncbi:MAG: SPOR domain-containing protein [candidate division KSB1 bacterium]|nr:SPOR domain-containing protein [candidate division KSB1 bacterium]
MRGNIAATHAKNIQLEQQIKSNQATVDQVLSLEDHSKRLRKNLALADSLSKGHDEFLAFLQKLNRSVERTGGLWIEEILKQKEGFTVKGASLNREKIPMLAEKLEQASLRKVTRAEAGSRKLFSFELERFNASDNKQFSQQGISMIDAAQYTSSGNLILSKEGVRSAPPSQLENASSRAAAGQNQPSSRSPLFLNEKAKRDEGAERNAQFKPVIKQAFSTQPAFEASSREENFEPPSPTSKPTAPLQASRRLNEEAEMSTPVAASAPSPSARFTTAQYTKTNEETFQRLNGKSEASSPASDNLSPSSAADGAASSAADGSAAPEIYRGYTIEAVTSYTRDLAEQYAAAYRKQGFNAAIESYTDERVGTKRFRVLVGIFPNRPAAEKKAEQISALLSKEYRIIGLK